MSSLEPYYFRLMNAAMVKLNRIDAWTRNTRYFYAGFFFSNQFLQLISMTTIPAIPTIPSADNLHTTSSLWDEASSGAYFTETVRILHAPRENLSTTLMLIYDMLEPHVYEREMRKWLVAATCDRNNYQRLDQQRNLVGLFQTLIVLAAELRNSCLVIPADIPQYSTDAYSQILEDMDHMRAYPLSYLKMELWNALDAAFSSDLYEREEVHPSDWLLLYRISIAFAEIAYSIIENCPPLLELG